jgi:hypothetical protein
MSDYNKLLILISVIQLSGGHCNIKLITNIKLVEGRERRRMPMTAKVRRKYI